MDRSIPYIRRIARDVLAVSVGFGLGISYSLVGGIAPDFADLPAEGRRSDQSSTVSAATWSTIPGVFLVTNTVETFALNPAAILMADRVGARADLDPIWRKDPDTLGAKVNVSPMILYPLTLC